MNKQIHTTQDDELVNAFLESDDYYAQLATPLKSSQIIKQEHKRRLAEIFELKDFKAALDRSIPIMQERLPNILSKERWQAIREEFLHAEQHALDFGSTLEGSGQSKEPIYIQQLMGFSDQTLLDLYELGYKLISETSYQDALAIFTLLTFINPQVPLYWMGQGISHRSLNHLEEATEVFETIKLLDPTLVAPYIYLSDIYLATIDKKQAQQELQKAEKMCKESKDESIKWGEYLLYLKSKIDEA